LEIPDSELAFVTSRSSGPGGQNVNKVDTRVTLLFDVAGSASLSDDQRALISERLSGRINRLGILRVTSQRHRTQSANRAAAMQRFAALIGEALVPEVERTPTRVSAEAKEQRLREKHHRARIKRGRALDFDEE
jgi:ribosome-associated protein